MSVNLNSYGGILRDVGYEGGFVDQEPFQGVTRINDQLTPIFPGRFVARSAQDETVKQPAADTDVIVGFASRYNIRPADYLTLLQDYKQFDALLMITDGYMFAIPFENVNAGDRVVSLTAQGGKLGSASTAPAGVGRVLAGECTWDSTTPAGTVGRVRIVFKP